MNSNPGRGDSRDWPGWMASPRRSTHTLAVPPTRQGCTGLPWRAPHQWSHGRPPVPFDLPDMARTPSKGEDFLMRREPAEQTSIQGPDFWDPDWAPRLPTAAGGQRIFTRRSRPGPATAMYRVSPPTARLETFRGTSRIMARTDLPSGVITATASPDVWASVPAR